MASTAAGELRDAAGARPRRGVRAGGGVAAAGQVQSVRGGPGGQDGVLRHPRRGYR